VWQRTYEVKPMGPAARTAARVDQHAQPGSVDELKRGHLNTHARVGIAERAQLALDRRAGREIEVADQRQRPDAIGVVGSTVVSRPSMTGSPYAGAAPQPNFLEPPRHRRRRRHRSVA
jgi:hypothetical protein